MNISPNCKGWEFCVKRLLEIAQTSQIERCCNSFNAVKVHIGCNILRIGVFVARDCFLYVRASLCLPIFPRNSACVCSRTDLMRLPRFTRDVFALPSAPRFVFLLQRPAAYTAQNFRGGKCFDFNQAIVFCLGHCLSKHKMSAYARNLGGP